MQQASFRIDEFDCAEEIAQLRSALEGCSGIVELDFDILNACMKVDYDDGLISPGEIIQRVSAVGLHARPFQPHGGSDVRIEGRRTARNAAAAISGACLCCGLVAHLQMAEQWHTAFGTVPGDHDAVTPPLAISLYAVSIVAGLWFVLPRAWHALRQLRADMNILMCVAVAGAVVIGEWLEAATVTFLFAFALLLENWSLAQARRAIGALLNLTPTIARCRSGDGDTFQEKPVDEVRVGEIFIVRPGEAIPLDGIVNKGHSDVDQAPITGESVPLAKRPGDEVYAGTINADGMLEVESTRPADDTTLARITHLVRDAQGRRAVSERWVERFAQYYTPAMVAFALLIALVPPLLFSAPWSQWFYNGLVVLVIACPCAMVISTPVSIVAALTSAARHGVLVKGGLYLEVAAGLKALALDKTGTLTKGHPEVQTLIPLDGHTQEELLERAAAMEAHSTHPVARAIRQYARQQGITELEPEQYRVLTGVGVEGVFRGQAFWIGGTKLAAERSDSSPEIAAHMEAILHAGQTVVAIGNQRHVCGLLGVADRIRPEANAVVQQLRRLGVKHVVMLTGDNAATAQRIADQTGVDEYRSAMLPEDKLQAVEALRRDYGSVSMVGDGVNDAPALAASDLGIAMAAIGSDTAIETADIALMSDDLPKIPWLIAHARRTLSTIRMNVAFALGLKALFMALTLAGMASLWMAIAADTGASLLVVLNGLRLLRPASH